MGLVDPPAREIITEPPNHGVAEIELRRLRKRAVQAVVVGRRLIADRAHDRDELAPQVGEQRADRLGRHADVVVVDHRIGDVLPRGVEARIFAAELDVLFKIRPHRGEIVCRPRLGPRDVSCRAQRIGAFDPVSGHADRPLEVAPGDAHEARLVAIVGQAVGVRDERVEKLAELRIDGSIVGKPAQGRDLTPACVRPLGRHVGRHVPVEHGAGVVEVADLQETPFDLGELLLRRQLRRRRPRASRASSAAVPRVRATSI